MATTSRSHPHQTGHGGNGNGHPNHKKGAPPDQTHAENFYFVKQMQARTPMVVVLQDGETIHGVIEWYDKHCIKVHRDGDANLLIYKSVIKYIYKDEEEE
jgi:sRNA-binding regulator protein Hfq